MSTIVGPLCILIGIGFLASLSINERGDKLATFNAAVKAWPAKSTAFAGLSVTAVAPSYPTGAANLTLLTNVDSYPDTDGATLPTTGLHYGGASLALQAGPSGFLGAGSNRRVDFTITPPGGGAPVISQRWPVLFKQTSEKNSGNNGGDHPVYWHIVSICAVVDASFQVVGGCALDASSGSAELCGMARMEQASVGMTIPVDVRSIDDPYVVAMKLTNGTLQFGITLLAKAIAGGVLLGVGLLLFTSACNIIAATPPPEPFMVGMSGPPVPGLGMHEQGIYAPTMGSPQAVPYAMPVQADYGMQAQAPQGISMYPPAQQYYGQPQMYKPQGHMV